MCVCIYIYIYITIHISYSINNKHNDKLPPLGLTNVLHCCYSTVDNMLKLTISPQAKRAETDPCQGTPRRAHLQPPETMSIQVV